MALQTTLHWLLEIGGNPQYIDEDVLDFSSHDNQENERSDYDTIAEDIYNKIH